MDHLSSNPYPYSVQKKEMKSFNQIFPAEIISDILSRLPTESVFDCKLVCTTWKNLIQNPSFPKLHLTRLNSTDSGKLRYVFMDTDDNFDTQLFYSEYNDLNEDWNYVKPIRRKFILGTDLDDYILIGSFNGLVCVYGTQDSYDAMIINPLTKEYIALPVFDSNIEEYATKGKNSIRYYHLACGFGYLAETNEYKVVRIYELEDGEPNFVEVEVYTIGSGKGWRHVGRFGLGFIFYTHLEQTHGVFLNGCLHWRNTEGGMVVVFDLADERFHDHIPPPPMLTDVDVDEDVYGNILIGVSGGGILYYAVPRVVEWRNFVNVWLLMKKNDSHVMKEHEEHHSWGWSKVTSLDQREPFAFTKDGTILRYDQGNIKWFLSSTSTWGNYTYFSEISRQAYPHQHTFVSSKELGELDAEILKSRGNR